MAAPVALLRAGTETIMSDVLPDRLENNMRHTHTHHNMTEQRVCVCVCVCVWWWWAYAAVCGRV